MGRGFIVDRKNLIEPGLNLKNIEIKTILENEEADELLELQKLIVEEIEEEVNILTKASFTKINDSAPKGLRYCIAKNNENSCIGYGFGYIRDDLNHIFYIETIGVHPEYRGKGIGKSIKIKLVKSAFEDEKIRLVHVITQENNFATIKINNSLGFTPIPEE